MLARSLIAAGMTTIHTLYHLKRTQIQNTNIFLNVVIQLQIQILLKCTLLAKSVICGYVKTIAYNCLLKVTKINYTW